jgi:hypothetical protein
MRRRHLARKPMMTMDLRPAKLSQELAMPGSDSLVACCGLMAVHA